MKEQKTRMKNANPVEEARIKQIDDLLKGLKKQRYREVKQLKATEFMVRTLEDLLKEDKE